MHDDEKLDVVDRNDNVIGWKNRSELYREESSNIRVVNVFLKNDQGKIWIPRRSANKSIFPLHLDMSVGGYVRSGESYEEAFRREVKEELNLDIDRLQWRLLGHLTPYEDDVSSFMKVYEIKTNQTPSYNPKDFVEYFWLRPNEILESILGNEIAKDDLPRLIRIFYSPVIKYVCFDANGTIFDDVGIGLESCNRLLEYYGRPRISLECFQDTFTTPWIDFYKIHGVHLEKIDIPTHQKLYQEAHTSLAKEGLKLRPHTVDTLKYLRDTDFKLAILSSRNIKDLTDELKQTNIYELFHSIIGEDHIHKDGTQAEKKAFKLINELKITDNSQVLYIGDMIPDIRISREHGFVSGIISGGWQSEKRLRAEGPDYFFNSFLEIKHLFQRRNFHV
jgi:isopentenyl-diphosphate delta-isomerase